MRIYFILAALMGVFAFGSISLLAHAQEEQNAETGSITVTAPDTTLEPVPAEPEPEPEAQPEDTGEPSPEKAKRDKALCHTLAYGKIRGMNVKDKRTPEERDSQYMDCMSGLGYTAEEIDNSNAQ